MDLSVSAIAGISRATRPVSSDTQIAVLQRRLEALDKQRASAASSSDETATYRLQALAEQMGLLQTQIAQLQQAASTSVQQVAAAEPELDSEVPEETSDTQATQRAAPQPLEARSAEPPPDTSSAQRDAAAVARARADGALVGSNVDTYV